MPLSGVPDVLDELGDKLENETARDSSIDVDKTNEVDNNLDGSSSRALPCPDPPWGPATGPPLGEQNGLFGLDPLAFLAKVMGILKSLKFHNFEFS